MATVKVAFIGAGRMGEALIVGLLAKETLAAGEIIASDVDVDRLSSLSERHSIKTTTDNALAAGAADFVVLAVKPQQLEEVVKGLRSVLTSRKTVISIAAGVTVAGIRRVIEDAGVPIVRVMPNAPALVGRGVSAVVLPKGLAPERQDFVDGLFRAAGDVVHVDESDIDAVTAISGSGPAYFFLFVRELAKAGAKAGLSEPTALALARRTFLGSAHLLLETGRSEDELITAVASPGGTTEAALKVFASEGFADIIESAVMAALRRAEELAQT